jgi:acyl-CoA synthetase (AMP-forming)/AMP-acid ligase II
MMARRALGNMVVGNILATTAVRYPDSLAFYCSSTGRRFTFADVDARTNRLAQALLNRGRQRGDIVAFLVSNRAEMADIYFALARTGMVGLPLNYRLTAPELKNLLRDMPPKALIYEGRFAALAGSLLEAVPNLDPIVRIGGDGNMIGRDYEELLAAAPAIPPAIEIEEEDAFYFNLTSGTTGAPKAYILSHYNNATLYPFMQAIDMSHLDVVMTVFPIHGRVGAAWIIGSVMYGLPNVLTNFEPAEVLRLIEAEGVTILNVVPTMAAMMLSAQASTPHDLKSLRGIIFAGASLPASIREQTMTTLCRDIYEFYGMNEMGPLVLSTPEDRNWRPDSVGKPIAFSQVRIANDDGRDVGPNQVGEILGRTPLGALAYFGNPEKSAETFRDGWVHTGDLGCLDEEGFLFIRGRKKDVIITGGQNVYTAEVEEIVLRHGGVAECAVFGLPDDLWGERVVCVVVPRHANLAVEQLEAFCHQHLARFKVPKAFFVETSPLPRTATNKVQKFLLAERFGSRAGALASV